MLRELLLTIHSLHKNLVEHLNSEIGLGTVTNLSTAKKWLKGTFLYVRLKENPEHYHIEDQVPGRDLDERLENICRRGIAALEEHDLVRGTAKLQCTEFGDVMARYYLKFDTMKDLLALPEHAKLSEILSTVAQAAEFKDIRFRAGEKPVYKELNKNPSTRFPIPANIDSTPHKVSLIIQSVLGAIELPSVDGKHQFEYAANKAIIFQHAHRLVRCIIDCQLYLKDATSARNALMLARSLGSGTWDDSPLHMMQLDNLGIVGTRKLAAGGFKSIEDIENGDPRRIEMILSRNPPHGEALQQQAKAYPRLRISMKTVGQPNIKSEQGIGIKVKAEIGFLNDKPPETAFRKVVYVCLLAETSDGRLAHFARISGKKLGQGQEVFFTADLTLHTQTIRGYVMCDEFAGTQRTATLSPQVPEFMFPTAKAAEAAIKKQIANVDAPNTSKRRAAATAAAGGNTRQDDDEFGDAGIDDAALVAAEGDGLTSIDDFDDEGNRKPKSTTKTPASTASKAVNENWQPQQLANGKWACNHKCNKKADCKHLCCKKGLDRPPKAPKPKEAKEESDPMQTKLDGSMKTKKTSPSKVTQPNVPALTASVRKKPDVKEARDLDRAHSSVPRSTPKMPLLKDSPKPKTKATSSSTTQTRMNSHGTVHKDNSSDYGLDSLDDKDLPSDFDLGLGDSQPAMRMSPNQDIFNLNDDDNELLDTLFDFADGRSPADLPASSTIAGASNPNSISVVNNDMPAFLCHPPATTYLPNDHSVFITGGTSSSSLHNTPWQGPSKRKHEPDIEENNSINTYFPPSKNRKDSIAEEEDAKDEMLLSDSYQPEIVDMVTQDVVNPGVVDAEEDDSKTEVQEEEDKPEDVRLKEWFEKEFGTEMFTLVD